MRKFTHSLHRQTLTVNTHVTYTVLCAACARSHATVIACYVSAAEPARPDSSQADT